jgi:hypothetical protein
MKDCGFIIGACFGIALGIIYAWAIHAAIERKHAKEIEELVGDLNAYRVMAEWD